MMSGNLDVGPGMDFLEDNNGSDEQEDESGITEPAAVCEYSFSNNHHLADPSQNVTLGWTSQKKYKKNSNFLPVLLP